MVIAIDGPAGVGKSSIAKKIAYAVSVDSPAKIIECMDGFDLT